MSTTNQPVGALGEILSDTTVAAAMIDRLLHRSVVTLDGGSYRLRHYAAAADELRRVTTGKNSRKPDQATWGTSMSNSEEIRQAPSSGRPSKADGARPRYPAVLEEQ